MSHTSTGLVNCPEIQAQLNRAFTDCDKTKTSKFNERSIVDFLMSDLNKDGFLQEQISPGNAKRRTVELTYTPRILTNEFSATPQKVCTSSNERGMHSEQYTIEDVGLQYDESFPILKIRDICQDNDEWIGEALLSAIDGATRKMDEDLVADLTTIVGAFGDGEDNVVANVKTVSSKLAGGAPDPEYLEDISFAGENAGYCSVPYVFGYQESYRAARRQSMTGCCADSGLDFTKIASEWPIVFAPNVNVPSTFGSDHFISLERGAVQLIWWNEFAGNNVIDTDTYKQLTVIDPRTGIPFDVQMNNDCGVWNMNLKLAFKAVGMPTDMFDTGDRYEDVTGVNEYHLVNP